MEGERKKFFEKLISYCIFFQKLKRFSISCSQGFLTKSGHMQFPACDLKFCTPRGRVACVVMAHAASHVMFHGYFESTFTKQYSTKVFQKLMIHLSSDSYV